MSRKALLWNIVLACLPHIHPKASAARPVCVEQCRGRYFGNAGSQHTTPQKAHQETSFAPSNCQHYHVLLPLSSHDECYKPWWCLLYGRLYVFPGDTLPLLMQTICIHCLAQDSPRSRNGPSSSSPQESHIIAAGIQRCLQGIDEYEYEADDHAPGHSALRDAMPLSNYVGIAPK